MKTHRLLVALTVANLALLVFLLARTQPIEAQGVTPVLRGRALEIVDDHGKVRAAIKVLAPSTMPDGKTYPETVLLRLIDPNGRPSVKLGASVQGAGLGLGGESDPTARFHRGSRPTADSFPERVRPR